MSDFMPNPEEKRLTCATTLHKRLNFAGGVNEAKTKLDTVFLDPKARKADACGGWDPWVAGRPGRWCTWRAYRPCLWLDGLRGPYVGLAPRTDRGCNVAV